MTDRTQILKNIRDGIKGRFPLYNLGFGHDVDLNFLEIMHVVFNKNYSTESAENSACDAYLEWL